MANFSLERFRQEVLNSDLARPNQFEVLITPPPGLSTQYAENVSLLCESTQLPQMVIATKPFKIQGPAHQMPVNVEYGGEGIQLSFHVDGSFNTKKFFDEWMHLIVTPGSFTMNFQKDYTTRIIIDTLDRGNNISYSVTLVDAFPKMMNLVDLNHDSKNQTMKLNVIFSYRYWETIDVNHSLVLGGVIVGPETENNKPPEKKQENGGKNDISVVPPSFPGVPKTATPPFIPQSGRFGGAGATGIFEEWITTPPL